MPEKKTVKVTPKTVKVTRTGGTGRDLREVMSDLHEQRRLHEQQRLAADAYAYRLRQAEALLREAGYVEQLDGTWAPPSD
ncbi:hypothetical protein ACFQ80_10905 [Isoptericola sp. NPDC056578]|uniref:hypothetical protein n=1 Tax=Isoptericola sp. NPDC056578 TaxID=3345870 RepID=UPI0036787196